MITDFFRDQNPSPPAHSPPNQCISTPLQIARARTFFSKNSGDSYFKHFFDFNPFMMNLNFLFDYLASKLVFSKQKKYWTIQKCRVYFQLNKPDILTKADGTFWIFRVISLKTSLSAGETECVLYRVYCVKKVLVLCASSLSPEKIRHYSARKKQKIER